MCTKHNIDAAQAVTRQLVSAAIEGKDEMLDLVAELARIMGVPYQAGVCTDCGGLADQAGDGWDGRCGSCADRADPS